MEAITVLQHNIQHWNTHKQSILLNIHSTNPDIVLINSHGLRDTDTMKIPNYTTHKINSSQEMSDGSAIAIRNNIPYRLLDDFITDILAIQIDTTLGPTIIATTYLPPS